jgi:hypothetical protein
MCLSKFVANAMVSFHEGHLSLRNKIHKLIIKGDLK